MPAINGRCISATLHLRERYLNLIEKGEKKIEARVNHGEVKGLKKGDLVCLTTGKRLVVAELEYVISFPTFMDLLKKAGLKDVLPGCKTYKQGVAAHRSFSPNCAKDEKQHGVVALLLRVRRDIGKAPPPASSRPASAGQKGSDVGGKAKTGFGEATSSSAPKTSQKASGNEAAKQGGGASSNSASKAPGAEAKSKSASGSVAGCASSSFASVARPAGIAAGSSATGRDGVPASSSSHSPFAGVDGTFDARLKCDRCDNVGHIGKNCPHFEGMQRESHRDAHSRGSGSHFRGNIPKHEDIMKGTIRGTASGDGCNCLIDTLRQLIAASKPSTCSKDQKRFADAFQIWTRCGHCK